MLTIQPMLSMFQLSLATSSITLQLLFKLFHPSFMGMFHYVCIHMVVSVKTHDTIHDVFTSIAKEVGFHVIQK